MSFTSNLNDIITQNSNGLLGKHKSWRRVNLSKIATIQNGFPFESSRFSKSEGTPLIRIDITRGETATFYQGEFDASFLVQAGEILVGMDGDFHCAPWTGIPALLNQRVCKIIPDESQYLKSFLRYVLPGYLAAINAHTNSVTVKHLSSRTVADIPLPLPPLDEQRRIVAEIEKQFTRLDTGVAALQRVQSKLKRYRASVLKSACEGRLVPTESELARAEGRDYESAKVLLQRILTERREKWNGRGKYKEPAAPDIANLPELPEGWVWAKLEQLAWSSSYGTSAKCSYDNSGLPVLRIPNIAGGRIDLSDVKFAGVKESIKVGNELTPGDLLIIRTNGSRSLIGRSAVIQQEFAQPTNYASYLIRFRLIPEPNLFTWIATIWDSGFLRTWIEGRAATSAGQHNISMTVLNDLPIPLPPIAEQERIVAEVERRLSVVDELEATVTTNLQRATRLRQSILQQAFCGKLVTIEVPQLKLVDTVSVAKRHANRHFMRSVLSGEIVGQLHDEPTFGRVKHQKILHLCEYIAELEEIEGEYHRKAAGPMDNKLIFANVSEMKKQKWYTEIKVGKRSFYKPLEKAGYQREYFERYWPDKIATIERLLKLMRTWNTENCEIFSTTYAAWNDLLIWGKEATEEAILHEILDRWDDSKKRISEKKWRKAISWIERKGFAPVGFGRSTTEPEKHSLQK